LTASEDKLQAAHAVINNDGLSTFWFLATSS
jgi:hypothetical protein